MSEVLRVAIWFGGYVLVACAIAGVLYQLDPHNFWDDVGPGMAAFWPLTAVAFAVVGLVWCLSWAGRGPVLLARWLIARRATRAARPRLPQMRTRR